ncbi:MAG: hypothetical protein EGP03_01350 [SAR202 cluster bacterium]|nr:MAG: hypothetical protein EGP03_01350 [SAR202 cluster bacterium]
MDSLSLPVLWIVLAGLAGTILVSATQLTKNADIIAFKTGLGRSFVGVVLLATATSLPGHWGEFSFVGRRVWRG